MPPIEPGKIRKGNKLTLDNDIWTVVDFAHTKPGKGQAFVTARIKSLTDGRVLERTWKIGEMLETAQFEKRSATFLYNDDDGYHFMDLGSYEQFTLDGETLGMAVNFMQPEMEVIASWWEERPIAVDIPPKVTLEVTDTIEAVRGNTATQITKDATLDNGFVIQVPPFIKIGEKVIVNTETGEYVERA